MQKDYKLGVLDLDYNFSAEKPLKMLSELNLIAFFYFIFLVVIGMHAIVHGGVTSTNVEAIVEQSSLTLALTV